MAAGERVVHAPVPILAVEAVNTAALNIRALSLIFVPLDIDFCRIT